MKDIIERAKKLKSIGWLSKAPVEWSKFIFHETDPTEALPEKYIILPVKDSAETEFLMTALIRLAEDRERLMEVVKAIEGKDIFVGFRIATREIAKEALAVSYALDAELANLNA